MSLNDIRIALESHLAAASGLPSIAWPNVPFTPTTGTAYLRAQYIPLVRRPVVAGPGPEQRYSGLFMVNIYTPEDAGAAAGIGHADRLLSWFNGSDAVTTTNVIVRLDYSEAKGALHEPPFYVIPVEIGWYSYVS